MRIAILGATSQIAKDLVASELASGEHELFLFARRPDAVDSWIASLGNVVKAKALSFERFDISQSYDAIINFVGIGNPEQAAAMGASIFDITLDYDKMALRYLNAHCACKYIFLSSGAAYGSNFERPVNEKSKAEIDFNNLKPQDWYGAAKLHAECRHRSRTEHSIFDVRVFNYFSHTQDLEARFFITDALRAIRDNTPLHTADSPMVRDYVHPSDFSSLIHALLQSNANTSVDCYSLAPVEKTDLLAALGKKFGLRYELVPGSAGINATGAKPNYYSTNKRAADFGYLPKFTALDAVLTEADIALHPGRSRL